MASKSTKNSWMREVPLLSAAAKVIMTATRGGEYGKVMIEVFPFPHEGNAPGMLSRYMLHWKQCLKLGMALKTVAQHLRDGDIPMAPGVSYAPVMLNLGQGGEFDPGIRLVLTADDCETWMHFCVDGAEFAQQAPGIVLGALSR